jgi:5-methyltetrahydropteroyltriglutamate--homocysteine methyltransferase
MLVTATGRFPVVRHGEHPLRAALEAWRTRGAPTPESALRDPVVLAAQTEATRALLAAQEAAGVDIPTDGYIPIYDEWYAWAPSLAGIEAGGHIRYLDTNTYYHRWRVTGRLRRLGAGPAVAALQRALALTDRPLKPCLYGPYTLWAYAVKDGSAGVFDAFVEIWAAEVAALAAAGARYVQLDESVLLRAKHRAAFPLVAAAVERIAAAAPGVTLILHLGCGAVGDLLEPLLGLRGLGGLGLDFTDVYRAPNLAALARWRAGIVLQAGVVDARGVQIEPREAVHETLARVTSYVPAERCLAAPSTGLHYLPYHTALEKLGALAAASHSFTASGRGAVA